MVLSTAGVWTSMVSLRRTDTIMNANPGDVMKLSGCGAARSCRRVKFTDTVAKVHERHGQTPYSSRVSETRPLLSLRLTNHLWLPDLKSRLVALVGFLLLTWVFLRLQGTDQRHPLGLVQHVVSVQRRVHLLRRLETAKGRSPTIPPSHTARHATRTLRG